MKTKTIRADLRAKFDKFCASIDDAAVRTLVEKNTIITGGAIASMLLREPVNDYDLYFRNEETCFAVAKYYADKFAATNGRDVEAKLFEGRVTISVNGSKNESVAEVDDQGEDLLSEEVDATPLPDAAADKRKNTPCYTPLFLSSNSITLNTKIQLVIRFYGEPDEIHENYDFVHCTNYWKSWDDQLVLRTEALESLLTKELRYIGSRYPVCSLIRTRKFIKRDFTINAGQYVKMAWQISHLNLSDIEVLKDQLVGVDSIYFTRLISALERRRHENGETCVTSEALMEIIDQIF